MFTWHTTTARLHETYCEQVAAEHARDSARESALQADNLNRDVEKLYLAVQAMWELMKERTGLKDEDLLAKMREIDLSDGRVDGKDATQTKSHCCPNCGRMILTGQVKCSWCGAESVAGPFTHIGKR